MKALLILGIICTILFVSGCLDSGDAEAYGVLESSMAKVSAISSYHVHYDIIASLEMEGDPEDYSIPAESFGNFTATATSDSYQEGTNSAIYSSAESFNENYTSETIRIDTEDINIRCSRDIGPDAPTYFRDWSCSEASFEMPMPGQGGYTPQQAEALELFYRAGILSLEPNVEHTSINGRSASCITSTLDFSTISEEGAEIFEQETGDEIQPFPIKMDERLCFDDETGITLKADVSLDMGEMDFGFNIPPMRFTMNMTATLIETNIDVPDSIFESPA